MRVSIHVRFLRTALTWYVHELLTFSLIPLGAAYETPYGLKLHRMREPILSLVRFSYFKHNTLQHFELTAFEAGHHQSLGMTIFLLQVIINEKVEAQSACSPS